MKSYWLGQSLQARLTLLVVLATSLSLVAVGLIFGHTMQDDLQRVLEEKKLAETSYISHEINREFDERLRALAMVANDFQTVPAEKIQQLKHGLATRPLLQSLFNAGIDILDAGQIAAMERDAGDIPLRQCRACVWKPVRNKSGQVILPMLASFKDAEGHVSGAVIGRIDLNQASFLKSFTQEKAGTLGEYYLLVAPQYRMIVTASDSARIMELLPPPGVNPSIDRFINGDEGSSLVMSPSGKEVFATVKRISSIDWYVAALTPKTAVFAPIRSMQEKLVAGIVVLMLLLGTCATWIVRRQFAPLHNAVEHLNRSRKSGQILARLPISGRDEVGRLVGAFNEILSLVETREVELRKAWLILEQSPESILVADHHGHIEYVNASFVRTTGYTFGEVYGQTMSFLHSGKTPAATYDALWQALNNGEVWRGEFINLRKDGSEIIEAATIAPVRQQDGQTTHYVAIKLDVTTQRQQEAELERHHHQLEVLVGERTAALHEAINHANEASRAKSDFLASMSHEIRTPLNGVLGMAQIGHRDTEGKTQETFARILDSGKLLLTIINDILDFSKIEAGKIEIERITIDPVNLLHDAAEALKSAASDKGLSIIVQKSDLPRACLGDPVRIAQILLNLLSNAVKFTQNGDIFLRAGRERDEMVYQIVDHGIGISPETQARLFQPFEQADASTTRKFGGTGLGLAISRRLAGLMGGTLSVDSVLNEGSTFTLRLPLEETDQSVIRSHPPGKSGQKRLCGLNILVAEDNGVNQLVLEDCLVQEGASVTLAENGRLAIEAIAHASAPFDLVLMDMQMPEMDGLEATENLCISHPNLPIIGQTAHALRTEHDKCLAAGMIATITKPIDIEALVAIILEHTGCDEAKQSTESLANNAHTDKFLVIDWNALNRRYCKHPDFVNRLIVKAIETHRNDAQRLRACIHAGNGYDVIGQVAHALKGIAGNLMAFEVERVASRTMKSVAAGQDDIHIRAEELADAMDSLIQAMESRYASSAITSR